MSLPLATPITNDDEYYAARERIKDLSHSLKGSPEDDVLIALSVAVETWKSNIRRLAEHQSSRNRAKRSGRIFLQRTSASDKVSDACGRRLLLAYPTIR
jgi:hypothetical protein